jgi:hypothetical protein
MGKRRNSWVSHSHQIEPEITFKIRSAESLQTLSHSDGNLTRESAKKALFPIDKSVMDTNFPTLTESMTTQKVDVGYAYHKRKESVFERMLEHIGVGFYVFGFVFAPFVLTFISIAVFLFPPLW